MSTQPTGWAPEASNVRSAATAAARLRRGPLLGHRSSRAINGPFSALESLQRHTAKTEAGQLRGGGYRVSIGEHPHCASPPVPAPRGLEDLRRVSEQPSEPSMDSCLSWFSVDLFLDDAGRISAVTLDMGEP